mmetsp:Transcript_32754/g.94069  ORF Transcript_32754/g.94069 Transcript_32754/m.94069 type:complete len:225 (-) Transcript_32754:1657-2331(-)
MKASAAQEGARHAARQRATGRGALEPRRARGPPRHAECRRSECEAGACQHLSHHQAAVSPIEVRPRTLGHSGGRGCRRRRLAALLRQVLPQLAEARHPKACGEVPARPGPPAVGAEVLLGGACIANYDVRKRLWVPLVRLVEPGVQEAQRRPTLAQLLRVQEGHHGSERGRRCRRAVHEAQAAVHDHGVAAPWRRDVRGAPARAHHWAQSAALVANVLARDVEL